MRLRRLLKMPARQERSSQSGPVHQDSSPAGEPAAVTGNPLCGNKRPKRGVKRGRFPIAPDELAGMSIEEKMLMCVETLAEKSGDERELESLFHELPDDFRARALIELVSSEALRVEELDWMILRWGATNTN
jgi:hypothetical protein